VLLSAKMALAVPRGSQCDSHLSNIILRQGRAFLATTIPELRDYQLDGGIFLASVQRALLLDEMGLGKTVQAIAGACLLREFGALRSCLIVAPKSVLPQWEAELKRFAGEQCVLVQGDSRKRETLYRCSSFFKAVTLESLRQDFPRIGAPDLVVFDEVQRVRDVTTLSNRVIRSLESRFFFGLSGTAIEKSLEDLYGILRAVRCPELESPVEFYASHIVCDPFGKVTFTHHPEFFSIRHSDRILRRLKSEVESTLPRLCVEHVELGLTALQEEMAEPLLEELEIIAQRLRERYEMNDFIRHRSLINRIVELSDSTALLDQATSSSCKLEWLSPYLRQTCVLEQEKVVIFTRWTRSQGLICDLCAALGIPFVSLSGEDSVAKRRIAIDSFTTDKCIRAFVSTDAGGVGVNLHSARCVVNFEPAWNPSTNAQRIQRVHRIGQTREVKAVYLLTPLDQLFVLSTHGRKSFSPDRIDAARLSPDQSTLPTWEELLPVIDCFRVLASKGVQENQVTSRWIAYPA